MHFIYRLSLHLIYCLSLQIPPGGGVVGGRTLAIVTPPGNSVVERIIVRFWRGVLRSRRLDLANFVE